MRFWWMMSWRSRTERPFIHFYNKSQWMEALTWTFISQIWINLHLAMQLIKPMNDIDWLEALEFDQTRIGWKAVLKWPKNPRLLLSYANDAAVTHLLVGQPLAPNVQVCWKCKQEMTSLRNRKLGKGPLTTFLRAFHPLGKTTAKPFHCLRR